MSYSGDIVSGKRHGRGTYSYPNPFFTYEGDWVNGRKHGNGKLSMGNGSVYEGVFVDGEIEGHGVRTWPDGTRYEGEFKQGEFHGRGTISTSTGERYTGDWADNKRHGHGELIRSNGDKFSGGFKRHLYDGVGTLTASDGTVYEGDWVEGSYHGSGLLRLPSGVVYTGQFHGGLRHGNGSITTPSGFTFSGTFVEDSACGGGTGVVVAVDAWSPPEETVDPKKKKAAKPKKGDEEPPADPLGTIAVKAGLIVPALTLRVTSDPHDESAHPVVHGVTWLSPTPAADDVTVKIAAAESGRVLSAQLFSVALDPVDGVDTPKPSKSPSVFRLIQPSVEGEVAASNASPQDVTSVTLTTTNGVAKLDNVATSEALAGGLYRLVITDVTTLLPYGTPLEPVNVPVRIVK